MYKHYEASEDVFVDREEHIEWMNNALERCKKNSVVLHLRGIGGIGKSSLLNHWFNTHEKVIRLDCGQHSEFYQRLNILAKGAILHGVKLQRFDILWQIRQRFVEGVEPVREEGREWAKEVVMAIPFIGSLAQIGNAIRAVGTQVTPKFKGKYGTVGKWLQERLGKNHIEQLLEILWKEPRRAEFLYLDALLEDINDRKDVDSPILFLIDQFEYVESQKAQWRYQGRRISEGELWSIFLFSLENCVSVMAGRKPALMREGVEIEETELTELDKESCIEILELKGVLSKELQNKIVSVSGGNPFIIDAVCDMSEIGNISVKDIENLRAGTLEEVRLKTWKRLFSDAQDLLNLVDRAGLLPFFNREIMNIVSPEMKTDHWNRLVNLSFVIERDDGNYMLHDLAEELVRAELGNRLEVIAEEVAGLLEKAFEKNDDFIFFGLSLSVEALAAPEDALEKLKQYHIRIANTPISSKLLILLNAIEIDTDIAKLFILFLKGRALEAIGRFADGEHSLRSALEGMRELSKNNANRHLEYLSVFQLYLAFFLYRTYRFSDAEKEFREGFAIFNRYKEKNELQDPWIATMYAYVLSYFVDFLLFNQQLEEAKEKLNEIILFKEDYLKLMSEFEPELAWSAIAEAYQKLAVIYGRMGRLAKAEEAIHGAFEGPLRPISKRVLLLSLFYIFEKTANASEAEKTMREIIRVTRSMYETDSAVSWPGLVIVLIEQARFLRKLSNYPEAEEALEEAIHLAEHHAPSEGINSDLVFWPLDEYAILQKHLGNYKKAKEIHMKELESFRRAFERHPSMYRLFLVSALNNLAILQRNTGMLEDSEKLYKEAIAYIEQESGHFLHGELKISLKANVLNNYSLLMKEDERKSQSKAMISDALQIKRNLVKDYPENLLFLLELSVTLNNLGIILAEANRTQEAENIFLESLEIRRKLVIKSDEYFEDYLLSILNNLGIIYRRLNQPINAERMYQEAVSIGEKLTSQQSRVYQGRLARILANFHMRTSEIGKISESEQLSNHLKELGIEVLPKEEKWFEEEEEI